MCISATLHVTYKPAYVCIGPGFIDANGAEEDDYERQSVKDIRKQFNKPAAQAQSRK